MLLGQINQGNFMVTLLRWNRAAALAAVLMALSTPARAEILQLVNGDQYRGMVIGMNASNVVFQSEIQGRVILPRAKIAQIVFREVPAKVAPNSAGTNAARPLILSGPPAAPVPAGDAITEQMRQQGVDPKIVDQVQQEIFGKSSPA